MKCTKCQGEWTPPANQSLGKCPFCQADILQMLNEQAEMLSTEVILANMLQAYSTDLLQNQQRLSAMISDLFAHDLKTKRLLLLSVRENIPNQLLTIQQKDTAEQNTHLLALQHRLAEEAFLKEEVAEQIVSVWSGVMNNEESDESFQIVWQNGFCGFMNDKNVMITPYKYDKADSFIAGLSRVNLNGKWGFINNQGNEIIPIQYDEINHFSDGLALAKSKDKYGFIDRKGNVRIEIQYDGARSFSEGLAAVKLNNKRGFVDKQGALAIPLFQYDAVGKFSDGLAVVKLNSKCGYIDKFGEVVIPIQYEIADSFSEGLAVVVLNGKYGYINKQGKVIIPFQYDKSDKFSDGLARADLNLKKIYIDKLGNWVKDRK